MIVLSNVPDAFETAIDYSGQFRYVIIGWSPFRAQLLMNDGTHLLYCPPFPFLYLFSEPASGITPQECNLLPCDFVPKLQAEERVARYGSHDTSCGALLDRSGRTLKFDRFSANMEAVRSGNDKVGGNFWPIHGMLDERSGERVVPDASDRTEVELYLELRRRADNEVFAWIRERRF